MCENLLGLPQRTTSKDHEGQGGQRWTGGVGQGYICSSMTEHKEAWVRMKEGWVEPGIGFRTFLSPLGKKGNLDKTPKPPDANWGLGSEDMKPGDNGRQKKAGKGISRRAAGRGSTE